MKLKSTKNKSFILIPILALLAILLFLLKNSATVEEDKFPDLVSFEKKTSLNFLAISLSEKSYKKLKKKRDQAKVKGLLEVEDSDFVPAIITFNGEDFKAEIRLKGDWTSHLEGEKWSFRVKLKDDKTILGMRKFSLQHPQTRRYLNEWMYHKAVKREGLIGLRYHFTESIIRIKTNNFNNPYVIKDVGIYALEESFDKRTIESNNRKESVILKFSEDYWWKEVKKSNDIAKNYGLGELSFFNGYPIEVAKYPITVFSEGNVLKDSTLLGYFNTGKNLLEDLRNDKINISDAFNIKKLAMDTALMNLFGAVHGAYIINVRYYYNPITSKLEPICYDGNSGLKLDKIAEFTYKGKNVDSLYLREWAIALNKVSKESYLTELLKETKEEYSYYSKNLKTEYSGVFFNTENLMYNQVIMQKEVQRLKKELQISDIDIPKAIKMDFKSLHFNEFNKWAKNYIGIGDLKSEINNKKSIKISRKNDLKSAFIKIKNIKVNASEYYEVSLDVKKDSNTNFFGLRLISKYPNRADAVFDINKGELKGVSSVGYFEEESASITQLKDDWYKCKIKVKPNNGELHIIFGPTVGEKSIIGWEGKTGELGSITIDPFSVLMKEVSQTD